jgi:hypothetical protein
LLKPYVLLLLPALFALAGSAPAPTDQPAPKHDVLDVRHLPLGDGRVSTSPRSGDVMSCQTDFSRGFGANGPTPWIHKDTWDLTAKPQVQGKLEWPDAEFSIAQTQNGLVVSRLVKGNGLPVKTATGNFPISPTDPAFAYDRNPNSIRKQTVQLTLPAAPQLAATPSCVSMGMIGVALNGVAIFNALDAMGRDAVAHEVQDLCSGHPEPRGTYHYHGPSPCLPGATQNEQLIGYAIDGFGIYSTYDAGGAELTNANLDVCHGRTSTVLWDGKPQSIYHYVLTREYPYTIGCFMGSPQHLHQGPPPGGPGGPGGFRRPPPPPM